MEKDKVTKMSETKLSFSDLPAAQKTKIRTCSKITFYSKQCKDCKNKLYCAEKWKIEKWFPGGEEIKMENEITKETKMKIIAVAEDMGDKMNFSKERIERLLKVKTGWDFKLKIVPVDTLTHGDYEI